MIDQSGGGQSFVLTLGAHTEDGHIRDGTCQLNDGLTLLMKKKTELSSHSCNNNDEHFESRSCDGRRLKLDQILIVLARAGKRLHVIEK